MLRRRKKDTQAQGTAEPDALMDGMESEDDPTEQLSAVGDEPSADSDPAAAPSPPAPLIRPQGPWDAEDAPEDEVNRIDLGGLRVPVLEGTEVRVDVSAEGTVVAATLVQGDSALQINAFAAPRSYGIWAEVREEIATALREAGGRAEESTGTYGVELAAAVPTEEGALAPARFLGIDGPRWFVRGLLTGPAATDRAVAAPLELALRDLVVLRGGEAMAVRDPLPLALPKEVAEQAAAAASAEGEPSLETADELEMPERGPEITEIR